MHMCRWAKMRAPYTLWFEARGIDLYILVNNTQTLDTLPIKEQSNLIVMIILYLFHHIITNTYVSS